MKQGGNMELLEQVIEALEKELVVVKQTGETGEIIGLQTALGIALNIQLEALRAKQ